MVLLSSGCGGGNSRAPTALAAVSIAEPKPDPTSEQSEPTPRPPRQSCQLTTHAGIDFSFAAGDDPRSPRADARFDSLVMTFPGGKLDSAFPTLQGKLRQIELQGVMIRLPDLYLRRAVALEGWVAVDSKQPFRPVAGLNGELRVKTEIEGLQLDGPLQTNLPCDALALKVEDFDFMAAFSDQAPPANTAEDVLLRAHLTIELRATARGPVVARLPRSPQTRYAQRWEKGAKRSRILIETYDFAALVWLDNDVVIADNSGMGVERRGFYGSGGLGLSGSSGSATMKLRVCRQPTDLFLVHEAHLHFIGTIAGEPIQEHRDQEQVPEDAVAIQLWRYGLTALKPARLALRKADFEACAFEETSTRLDASATERYAWRR